MRPDLGVVAGLVPSGSRVLDLGCGDGALLEHLMRERGCSGRGVEIDPAGFQACVARGVPVIDVDIDQGLTDFDDGSFDVVVLSQTLQATHRPALVLREMMRVGRATVVSFPNFGHWPIRLRLGLAGRMPETRALPHAWHDTPNIHLCAVADFERLCRAEGVRVDERVWLDSRGCRAAPAVGRRPNLLAAGAVYLLSRGGGPRPGRKSEP